jgi:hypothetical protein
LNPQADFFGQYSLLFIRRGRRSQSYERSGYRIYAVGEGNNDDLN